MNTALAFEIYRGIWLLEGSEDSFRNILREARTAVYDPSQKLNTFSLKGISTITAVSTTQPASSLKKEKKIAVTNISGIITKAGGPSSRGVEEISSDMISADNDPDVIGHFVRVNSPGGSETAMRYMQQTMKSLKKPKVTFVPRQGMAASGGYGIIAEGDWVMAESGDAEVGSHGVMWEVSGVPNGEKDGNGEVHFVVIASSSPDKNKAPLDAINKKDTTGMQKEVDQLHLGFLASTKAMRPNVKDEHLAGGMFKAADVVGSMIDAVGSETDAVNKILELSKSSDTFSKKNNLNKKAMTVEEIKSQFPDAHAAIYNAGVTAGTQVGTEAEQERVKSWQVYASVDPEAVNKGIASGKVITQSEMHSFLFKASSQKTLATLQTDSNTAVVVPEATTTSIEKTAEAIAKEKEVEAIFGQFYPKKN